MHIRRDSGIDTFLLSNLMSYHPSSTTLGKWQWQLVQNPACPTTGCQGEAGMEEEVNENYFGTLEDRKTGVARVKYGDYFYCEDEINRFSEISMNIYLYSDHVYNTTLITLKDRMLSYINNLKPTYIDRCNEGSTETYKLYFKINIEVIDWNTALNYAQNNLNFTSYYYIYDSGQTGVTGSALFGGNSGIINKDITERNFFHEIIHSLGFMNPKATYINKEKIDWTHYLSDENSIMMNTGNRFDNQEIKLLNFGAFLYPKHIKIIGMPLGNAIYNLECFKNILSMPGFSNQTNNIYYYKPFYCNELLEQSAYNFYSLTPHEIIYNKIFKK